MQPQLIYASSTALKRIWSHNLPMTDNGFVDIFEIANDGIETGEMLVDLERFGCIALDPDEEERARTGHYPRDLARKWAMENPLYLSFDGAAPISPMRLRHLPAPRRMPEPVIGSWKSGR